MHLLVSLREDLHSVCPDFNDFGGLQLVNAFIAQFFISEVLKGNAHSAPAPSDVDREPACRVPRRNDASLLGQNHNQRRSVNDLLRVADSFDQCRLAVDVSRNQFG